MTERIKPKKCGETAWYIPNQKGFVPEIGSEYFVADAKNKAFKYLHYGEECDYALIEVGNCFETEQEAIDAIVKPVDPTPLTWDELCEIAGIRGDEMVAMLECDRDPLGQWVNSPVPVYACYVRRRGRLNFEVNKYWRDIDSLSAWIEQQKGERK